jgi:hypothetical protein
VNVSCKLPFSLGFLGGSLGVAAAALACGCYTTQVDPDLGGAFACDLDDEDSECPEGQSCVNARCEDEGLVPKLSVNNPEDEQSLMRGDVVDLLMMEMPGAPIGIDIVIQGAITLVSADAEADPVFGEGHVRVLIDGEEQLTLDTEPIDSPTTLTVQVPPVAGPHRITLQAFRNDRVAYDNPEATATRLFWLEHENVAFRRPFVAIKSPWPDTVFDLDKQALTIELAAIHFEFFQPGGPPRPGQGHAHVYHNPRMDYPQCVRDPNCDNAYLPNGVVGASKTAEVELPEGDVGNDRLTAVLRNSEHDPYGFPMECNPAGPDVIDMCAPVFDAIEIVRANDE